MSACNDHRLYIETECGQNFNAHHAIIATGAARHIIEKAHANGIISLNMVMLGLIKTQYRLI